jgi:hypothetical protein
VPNLEFRVEGARSVPRAASPLLSLQLEIVSTGSEVIHTIVLRCQVQIEAGRRSYSSENQAWLLDLFGERERWSQTVRTMHWTNAEVVVPSFSARTLRELQLPCTFDFNVAATKYFYALDGGEVPLLLMFSGSIFYEASDGSLQVAPIPWNKETRFRFPVAVWREMMDTYYPNKAWLCLRRDAFERLYRYKMEHAIPTWEQALETLMPNIEEVAES